MSSLLSPVDNPEKENGAGVQVTLFGL